jgi:actin-related protein
MFHSGDDIGAIIADIGTSFCRIGFAGDDTPHAYLPSVRSRLCGSSFVILSFIECR